ncbi:MAG: 23S rRNA (uracil(1939)-C(5))-methyltransferase RlmD [Clostridiales bacterium]|jgi:23S rRNA (uracil-5-)-methyltransferase RumA|nr:23S rRNA (uracil(1939)-C(5))-methyltransferase RlmD [Clostridiales bacterium]
MNVCPHFGACGGCATQNLEYSEELDIKEKNLLKALGDDFGHDFVYEGLEAAPSAERYRNKMEFSFGDEEKGGPLALGLRKKGRFHEVVTVAECNIADRDFCSILVYALDFFRNSGETFYHKKRKTGALRFLVLRKGFFTGQILVNIVTSSELKTDLLPFAQGLTALKLDGEISGAIHTVSDSPADAVKADAVFVLCGENYFYENLSELTFKISPFSFFQTNSQKAGQLYETALEYAKPFDGKTAFDLYCGAGAIAQFFAKNGASRTYGVDITDEAILAAKENALANGLGNCFFMCGDVLKVIDDMSAAPDIIILDPPRDGVHPKALPKIAAFGSEKIVYLSCKPSSLARDARILSALGYEPERLKAHDMFPRTVHLEAVCLFKKTCPKW